MTSISQKNIRSILPGKIAQIVMMISNEEKCDSKSALIQFYKSNIYKELEIEQTKRWWQSPLELFEDYLR